MLLNIREEKWRAKIRIKGLQGTGPHGPSLHGRGVGGKNYHDDDANRRNVTITQSSRFLVPQAGATKRSSIYYFSRTNSRNILKKKRGKPSDLNRNHGHDKKSSHRALYIS